MKLCTHDSYSLQGPTSPPDLPDEPNETPDEIIADSMAAFERDRWSTEPDILRLQIARLYEMVSILIEERANQ